MMTILRRLILLIAIGLFTYQLRTGWNQLSDPDLLEVINHVDLKYVDPPLIAICPTGQFQKDTLQNNEYVDYIDMLMGILLSKSDVIAWGAQRNMSFDNMVRNMIDQELSVSLDTSEYFQERKFHPKLGICWLMKPYFETNGANEIDLYFIVQLRERDNNESDTENGKEKSSKDNGKEISSTENDTDENDKYTFDFGKAGKDNEMKESGINNGKQESGIDYGTELYGPSNGTELYRANNGTEESGKNDVLQVYETDNSAGASAKDNGTYKSTDESNTYVSTEESAQGMSTRVSANDHSLNEECKSQNAVQIFFLDDNMNTYNSFSLSAHKGDVISLSKGGVYEYEVALKVVSSSNPKNKSSCKDHLKDEYATCVDDNSQEIFMPVFGCNPPWFSPTNSCTGKIKDINKLENLKRLKIENYSLI